jgi:hypothetical protein
MASIGYGWILLLDFGFCILVSDLITSKSAANGARIDF